MEQLEEMDKARSVARAENRSHETLGRKEFREASLLVMKEKAREIRTSCWGGTESETIAMRLWRYIHRWNQGQPEKRRAIRDHLELYQDVEEWILEQLKELALKDLLAAGDEKRMEAFKDLVMLHGIEEEGCSHQESRVYHVWWLAATKGVQFTRADREWEDEECRWGSSWVNPEDLRR
jgi:hypothetical protein